MSRSKVSDKYVKMKPEEHVLARPGMYIGSMEKDEFNTWVLDEKDEKMIKKNIKYVPGLYKIYDELLVNVLDHMKRIEMEKLKNPIKNIKVFVDTTENKIEVYNDGDSSAASSRCSRATTATSAGTWSRSTSRASSCSPA